MELIGTPTKRRNKLASSRADGTAYFTTADEFRTWLITNHAKKSEVVVGFRKVGTGKPSLTWPQAVEEAIAFGWIDGIRHSVDADRYSVRFTPRKKPSTWSTINIETAKRLIEEGLMAPAGLSAFQARKDGRIAIYSYEQRKNPTFAPDEKAKLESDSAAWKYFQSRPPSYRWAATWWVNSAKMKETRTRRLVQLIECSRKGRPIPLLTPRLPKN